MSFLLYHHPACVAHDPGPRHSERAARLTRIIEEVLKLPSSGMTWADMPFGSVEDIARVHTRPYIDFIESAFPVVGYREIEIDEIDCDDDPGEVTTLGPFSRPAVYHAVGGACAAVDAIMSGETKHAFCATRPPGHHALSDRAMGFCVFNNIAIAAKRALDVHGLKKVAIVDFDVHHGNGTQAVFENDPRGFFCSVHQLPLWPESGKSDETGCGNILNVPVLPGLTRLDWLRIWEDVVLTRLEREEPEFLFVSAGFDAHKNDPKSRQNLETEDYGTITQHLVDYAEKACKGRVLSVLEGGYDIEASAQSAAAHVRALA